VLTVIPGPLSDDEIAARVDASGAVAIMKVGRHFNRLRALIEKMNLTAQAVYAERVTLAGERVMPLADVTGDTAPYFSIILIYKGAESWAKPAAQAEAQT